MPSSNQQTDLSSSSRPLPNFLRTQKNSQIPFRKLILSGGCSHASQTHVFSQSMQRDCTRAFSPVRCRRKCRGFAEAYVSGRNGSRFHEKPTSVRDSVHEKPSRFIEAAENLPKSDTDYLSHYILPQIKKFVKNLFTNRKKNSIIEIYCAKNARKN